MNDELREELEGLINEEKENLRALEPGTKEKQIQADVVQKLITSFNQSEETVGDWFDKQERRRIDEEKNVRLAEIEEKKTKLSPGKIAIEVSKFVVPALTAVVSTLLCIRANHDELEETCKFEETGRFISTAGRSHKRPNFWNKK